MKKIIKGIFLIAILLVVGFFVLQKDAIPLDKLKIKYANKDSKFLLLDSLNVHYRIEGEGNPIVLIHGTGASLQTWDEWTRILIANHFKVIRLDMPAFGLTGPRADNDYSSKMYVDFLDKFLTKINISNFALAGNSLGGEIAWKYALQYPTKVNNLILLDPAGFYNDKKNGAIVFKLAKVEWLANLMSKMDTKILVKKTVEDVFEDDSKITPEKIETYYDMSMRAGNRESFSMRVQQVAKEPKLDVTKISNRTLIQWGENDKLLDIELAQNFTKIPNSKLITYKKCGHSPQEEIAQKSAEDVIHFINKTE